MSFFRAVEYFFFHKWMPCGASKLRAFNDNFGHIPHDLDPFLLLDSGVQIVSCLTIFGMAYERFVLVCYPTRVNTYLNNRIRLSLYVTITSLGIITVIICTLDLLSYQKQIVVNLTISGAFQVFSYTIIGFDLENTI